MSRNSNPRLKPIGLKISKDAFARLQSLADERGKPLAEWCRDMLMEFLGHASPTPFDSALLAEIVATEEMLVGLLCAIGRDGKLTAQKAQEIVDAAHHRKYRDVAALFQYAQSRADGHKTSKWRERNAEGGSSDES